MKNDILEKLCEMYIKDYKIIKKEFDSFYESHISKLKYFNDHMVEIYKYAFIYFVCDVKGGKNKYCKRHLISKNEFENALKETTCKVRKIEANIENRNRKYETVCNLYSIMSSFYDE
ncbi:hypothetical protein CWI38_0770p0020 [Hamiltosporidium tvaerminnensis]|uniref:Uncharacterized protein n=1 Tax=Hamiltosporidium tvaerminnensis TaxID=1176355 RepID=A0A4V2JXM8_9MICR|nr:hypothetical protein CWI38_0770p0020 [Hamiltosporidium tvaerminnensis]